jgi:type II secretory pathway pseudopilin PulG
MNKKAFSFVEIIISISILVVLAIVATTATTNIKNNSNNSRVIADLATIKNGFISYSNEGANLADPQGNKNFYNQD